VAVTAAERASFRLAIGATLGQLAREIARDDDIAARELGVATELARVLRDLEEDLVGEIFDVIAEAQGGREVLEAISVAGETAHAVRARVRLDELGAPEHAPARLRVVRASELLADDEPVSALSLLCEREGEHGAQAFSFVLEHEVSGGAVKAGFATDLAQGKTVMGKLRSRPDRNLTELVEVDPAEAHARLVDAATQGARQGLAPDEDGLVALRIFLRAAGEPDADAIVQALELGRSLEDEIDDRLAAELAALAEPLLEDADAWFPKNVEPAERAVAGAEALALMVAFTTDYARIWFDEWSTEVVDELMLGWMPRQTKPDLQQPETLRSSCKEHFTRLRRSALRSRPCVEPPGDRHLHARRGAHSYSRRYCSKRRRWPSSSRRMSTAKSCVTQSTPSHASISLL
jgi:hypothetical protein